MIRALVLAGTAEEYYAWLRSHKIGWLEAVYINHPIRLTGYDHKVPIIRTGSWRTQSQDTLKAAIAYDKKYKEASHVLAQGNQSE